jgi:hypothetical protein
MVGWNEDRTTWTPLTAEKHVIIEIIGGDADGLVLDSKSPNTAEWQRVETILFLTNNGEIGRGIQGVGLTKWDGTSRGL